MRGFFKRLFQLALLFILSLILGLGAIALSTRFTLKIEQKTLGHQTHWGSSWERISEFETWVKQKSTQRKGLILGSSTAYRNLNPYALDSATNFNWFNYASSGQPPVISYQLLQHALSRGKFKVVLLDIYAPVVKLDGLETAHDLIYNSQLDWWNKTKMLCSYPEGKLWLRYLYYYIKRMLPTKQYIIEDPKNGTYLKKGFVCSNQKALTNFKQKVKSQKVPEFPELQKIAALCKANGAQLILNISPSLEGPYVLPRAFNGHTIIQIKNFNEPSLFYDSHHMTCHGANLYSALVAGHLAKILHSK